MTGSVATKQIRGETTEAGAGPRKWGRCVQGTAVAGGPAGDTSDLWAVFLRVSRRSHVIASECIGAGMTQRWWGVEQGQAGEHPAGGPTLPLALLDCGNFRNAGRRARRHALLLQCDRWPDGWPTKCRWPCPLTSRLWLQERSSGPCPFKAGTQFPRMPLLPTPFLAAAPSRTPPGLGADFILGSQRQGESSENKVHRLLSGKYFHLS